MTKKSLSFSYSKMSLYRECPQKFKFRYIHKIPEAPKYYFAFGNAMHKALEYLYGVSQPPFPTLQQVLDFFDADWRATSYEDKGYASISKELEGYDEGRRILVSYYQKHKEELFVPLAVEFRTTLAIDSLSLISIIDRVDYLGQGRVAITDYKTGKTVAREPDQLYMYQKVMEASPVLKNMVMAKDSSAKEVKVERMSFYHLPTLKAMDFDPAPEAEIKVYWDGVLKTADEIRAEVYTPSPSESKCRFCDYKSMCPVFTGVEYEEFAKTPKPSIMLTPKMEEDVLSAKIDKLAEIGQSYAALKKEIIAIMQERNYNQHFGTDYKVELVQKQAIDFEDKQAVVDMLKASNLLKKTLVPTQSTIEALLTDSDVPQDVKDKLRAMSRTVTTQDLQIKKVDK
ncbi:RecB family exonuclease [Elusimicrobium simillimum]|uniref:RecB family exonuclease n=1 Tax=Elusimicrobium simillimum TaxID=3143438 RepID=UPI003C6FF1C4